jgi:hypothetical protein
MLIIKPKKTTKSYKDCTLKGLILKSIKAGHNEAKDIHADIQYKKSLNALYAEMCRLSNYGYVSILKEHGISKYTLTKKGEQHAINPFICVEQKEIRLKNIVDKNVMAVLKDNDKMKQLAYEMALEMQKSSPSVITHTQQVPVTQTHEVRVEVPYQNQSEPALSSASLSDEYAQPVKPIIIQNDYRDEYGNRITFDEMLKHKVNKKDRAAQIKLRKKIAEEYFQKKYIYGGFFTRWGGNYELVKLRGGMLDIISTANPEFRRMHVESIIVPRTETKLFIERIDEHGVYISGERLKNKFLRF